MNGLRSWAGAGLALLYLVAATGFIRYELRYGGGGWINLKGMGVILVTAPSQATVGELLRRIGVPKINYGDPGLLGYAQIAMHLLLTAGLVYLLGFGLEWLVRRILAST